VLTALYQRNILRLDNDQPYQTPNTKHHIPATQLFSVFSTRKISKDLRRSPMTTWKVTDSKSGPTEQYGVYQHANLSNTTTKRTQLIHTAPDFTAAYTALCNDAGQKIDEHPEWGATSERTRNNTFEILGHDQEVQMRYTIDTIRDEGDPPEHYGMFVDLNVHGARSTKNFAIGGYKSLSEASNAMKTSARAYLTQHAGVRLMERSIELVNEKGEVHQRYVIVKGQWQNDEFVAGEDWLVGLKATEARNHRLPSPSSPSHDKQEMPQPQIAVLPDKLGTPASVPQVSEPNLTPTAPETWCTCRTADDGTLMIFCENNGCSVHWYHGRCVGVEKEPVGKWWCPTCAPKHAPAAKRKGRQSTPTKQRVKQGVKMEKGTERKKRKMC
jgi:hypothetical protein